MSDLLSEGPCPGGRLTNIAAKPLPDADLIIAAYGVVQRLVLIGSYVIMGFMQGYQPVASYAFGAKNEDRFHECVCFSLKSSLLLTVFVAAVYILLSRPLIMLFNGNPAVKQKDPKNKTICHAFHPAPMTKAKECGPHRT